LRDISQHQCKCVHRRDMFSDTASRFRCDRPILLEILKN
jgi:hypothetical protein